MSNPVKPNPFAPLSPFNMPSGIRVSVASAAALGSHMLPPSYGTWGDPAKTVAPPCPFSLDDVKALRDLAQPLRQVIGAPHDIVATPELVTALIQLEHITAKIHALVILHPRP